MGSCTSKAFPAGWGHLCSLSCCSSSQSLGGQLGCVLGRHEGLAWFCISPPAHPPSPGHGSGSRLAPGWDSRLGLLGMSNKKPWTSSFKTFHTDLPLMQTPCAPCSC